MTTGFRPEVMNPSVIHLRSDGMLKALCWCTWEIVWVHKTAIRAGRTGTCGAANCHEPVAG